VQCGIGFADLFEVRLYLDWQSVLMAMKMAKGKVSLLLVLVLASQWTSLHARSVPGDFDTAEYVSTEGGNQDPSQDAPSFAETFTTQPSSYNYVDSFADADSTDSADEDAVFVDSPESVTTTDTAVQPTTVFTQSQYENDEVFFDTSSADTVYKANDE
jgi:hypothetical protein